MTTTLSAVGAASHYDMNWLDIDWGSAHKLVRRLQVRIAKAVSEGRWNKAKALQWLLTHSFYGKAVAVKRVTENRGKKTPGVDGETWNTPKQKSKAVNSLKRRGYQPQPLRRVHIPKANGRMRPLGIPTMQDRAMQALHLLALQPVAETRADFNSYGFRPERACRDAAAQCFAALVSKNSAQWILDADISGCFDNISHDWLLTNIPMDKTVLRKWLTCGFVEKGNWFPTQAGTPQGGIVSSTLANMALDGIELELAKYFGTKTSKKRWKYKVNFIRYADDMVITGATQETLEKAKFIIGKFLKDRGLTLSEEKTKIVHIDEGFDFLGWNIRKYGGKLLIKPAEKNVHTFLRKIRLIIKANYTAKQENVIRLLNPIIRGWANYHQNQVAKKTYSKVDHFIWKMLWQWACRRHPNKSLRWIKGRYFKSEGLRNWMFCTMVKTGDGEMKLVKLVNASDTPIRRHIKIRAEANPFNPAWEEYFEERFGLKMSENIRGKNTLLILWYMQEGICPHCTEKITKETGWNVHYIQRKTDGGKSNVFNLMILHPKCHRQMHSRDK